MLTDVWSVPREWEGERCFILCSGESIQAQAATIRRLTGRFIAVRHGVLLRPNADVLFFAGEGDGNSLNLPLLPAFTGTYVVCRSKMEGLPSYVKCVTRTKDHEHLSELPTHVGGYDSGTSAIHLAHLFGATELVLCGYDMTGGHFCPHPLRRIPLDHFRNHLKPLAAMAEDAKRKGVTIWNASKISKATMFPYRALETFL